MAIACLRLLTVFPEPPDFSSPRFISCIARSTLLDAFFPYFRGMGDSFALFASAVGGD
jgi:hypothetical protein